MDHPSAQRLRFGILCDGTHLEAWQGLCLSHLTALSQVYAAVLLVAPASSGPALRQTSRHWLYHRYLDQPKPGSLRNRISLPGEIAALPRIQLEVQQRNGSAARLDTHSAETVRRTDLHFILSFGDTPLARELGDRARYGVWAYCFGDWDHYRGAPPGFWEVNDNANVSGAMLVRLTQQSETVVPLRRAYLRTSLFSYAKNVEQILERVVRWPEQICREILLGETECLAASALIAGAVTRILPSNLEVLAFASRILWRIATTGARSLVQYDHWNIGIVRQPIRDFLDPKHRTPTVEWLPSRRRNEFIADPFGVVRDGKVMVFCEFLDYRNGVGRIAALRPSEPKNLVSVTIGPVPAVHLSYPMVFEHDGRLLCIPESHAANEVALYAAQHFPDRWVKVATLIENAAIVDATLFRHEDRWWLAGAADPGQIRFGADLYLWYAAAITGPWQAHPGNPVKTDVRSSRPAGAPFVADGCLYRPAQDSSMTYGGRVVINRVLRLTPSSFKEEVVAYVEPDINGPYPQGLHTLSAVGDLTLIDGKRLRFASSEFRRILARMIRRRLPWSQARHSAA
jgi:hypothetical protein